MQRINKIEDAPSVVREVCHKLLGYDPPSNHLDLMLSTGAVESEFKVRKQNLLGPARGYWQVEPATAVDIFKTFLAYGNNQTDSGRKILKIRNAVMEYVKPNDKFWIPTTAWFSSVLSWDDELCIALTRLIYYRRVKGAIPDVNNLPMVWKTYYNTKYGKGKVSDYVSKREKLHIADLVKNEYKKSPYQTP